MAMTDLLIRDVPDEVVAALDADAVRLGLSRTEYLRRTLAQAVARSPANQVTVADLVRFENVFVDLGDDNLMRKAWH
jgi:plasmid stability protein